MHWFLALMLMTGVAFAQSKQPLPKGSPPTSNAIQPATDDQRGTDKVPLTVKILPTQKSQADTDKEDHERQEKADRKLAFETQRIADYTDRLALFTVLLFCVAVLQAGLFVWQLLYMRTGIKDASIAANAANLSARATVALQLPIITISPDSIMHGDTIAGGQPSEDCGVPSVIIGNRGATAAMPIETLYGYIVGEELPKTPSYQYLERFLPGTIIDTPPKLTRQTLTLRCQLSSGQWAKICGGNSFWFYCLLRYEDFMEEERSVGFCWRWSNTGMGLAWKAEKIPAYNRKT
jgi:hypothetical protein